MPIRVATVRAADVPSSQTDMPVYVDLGRVGATALTLAEAESSRWYTDTDLVTQMAREIVSLTEGHGKYASLTSTSKIAIDYDGIRADLAVGNTYGRNAVWSGNFSFVYHMEDNSNDSSGNGINGTDTSMSYNTSAGKIKKGADFNGSTGQIRNTHDFPSSYTHSFWFLQNNSTTGRVVIAKDGANRNMVYHWVGSPDNYLQFFTWNSSNSLKFIRSANGTVPQTTWVKLDIVWDNSGNYTYYVNGVVGATDNNVATSGAPRDTVSDDLWFGNRSTPNAPNAQYLDEVKFSSVVRSANWITTEYNNQNDEATFWGTWTTFGGGGFTPTPLMHMRMMAGGGV